jgi:hypothetical protein
MLKRCAPTYQLLNIKYKIPCFTGKMQLRDSRITEDYCPYQHCPAGLCDESAVCLLWSKNKLNFIRHTGSCPILGFDTVPVKVKVSPKAGVHTKLTKQKLSVLGANNANVSATVRFDTGERSCFLRPYRAPLAGFCLLLVSLPADCCQRSLESGRQNTNPSKCNVHLRLF